MGYDAAKWLRTHVEQAEKAADYTQAKVDTDLTAYEKRFGEQPQSLSGYSSGSRRNYPSSSREAVDRQKIAHSVREIGKIISNQL